MGKRVKAALAGYAARAASGDPQAVADYQAQMESFNAAKAKKRGGLFGHIADKYNAKNLKNTIMNPKNLLADLKYTSKQGLKGSFKDKRALLRQHHALTIHPFDSQAKDTLKARKMMTSSDPNVVAQGKALQAGVNKTTLSLGKQGAIAGALAGAGSYFGAASGASGTTASGATGAGGASVLDQSASQLLTEGATSGAGQGALQAAGNSAGQGALISAGNAAVSAAPSVTTQAPSLMSKIASGAKDLAGNKLVQTAALTAIGNNKNKPSAAEQALINQQAAAAAQAGAVGSGLLDQYKSGTLNAADQAQIDQYKQQALASTDQYLASAGLSDSSAGVEMRNKIEQNATVLYGQFRDQTLQQGLQALGVGTGGSGAAQLLQTLMQRDANASNAWASAAQTYMQLSALSA